MTHRTSLLSHKLIFLVHFPYIIYMSIHEHIDSLAFPCSRHTLMLVVHLVHESYCSSTKHTTTQTHIFLKFIEFIHLSTCTVFTSNQFSIKIDPFSIHSFNLATHAYINQFARVYVKFIHTHKIITAVARLVRLTCLSVRHAVVPFAAVYCFSCVLGRIDSHLVDRIRLFFPLLLFADSLV